MFCGFQRTGVSFGVASLAHGIRHINESFFVSSAFPPSRYPPHHYYNHQLAKNSPFHSNLTNDKHLTCHEVIEQAKAAQEKAERASLRTANNVEGGSKPEGSVKGYFYW